MSKIIVDALKKKSKIDRNIYGHFSEHLGRCIYGGLFVGENSDIENVNGMRTDVVQALKNIKIPVLRWPGGCFADEYHWKDGIGEKKNRKKMINTHWGGVVEDNSFGTHEFMELCKQLECEPYINGNVGSGTVQEMSEWVEYLTFNGVSPMADLRKVNGQEKPWKVKYWGVGNENWGCGGNMRPEYYSDLYRRFSTYTRNYGDNKLVKIACGANVDDYNWTDVLMKNACNYMDALTLHYYTIATGNWSDKGSATEFDKNIYYDTLKAANKIEELVSKHSNIMDKYDPKRRVSLIVDEWGTWFNVEKGTNPGFLYQQNTMRDAIVAAISLNVFNKHSERVRMANIAQTVNVLQSVILTEGDKMVLTPTYHVFDLYKVHQDATLLEDYVQTENIEDTGLSNLTISSSIDEDNTVNITVVNLSCDKAYPLNIDVNGIDISTATAKVLTGNINSYNDFNSQNNVEIKNIENVSVENGTVTLTAPPCSVILVSVK